MTDNKKEVPQWVKDHAILIQDSEYFKLPEGECTIDIDTTVPVAIRKSTYDTAKDRFEYRIVHQTKKYKMTVGYMLDSLITKALMKGQTTMTIIRVGQGTNTRFSIKGLS